jgi:hypothetical protein
MCLLGYIAKVKGIVSRDECFCKAFKIRKMINGLLFMKHFLIRKIRPIRNACCGFQKVAYDIKLFRKPPKCQIIYKEYFGLLF